MLGLLVLKLVFGQGFLLMDSNTNLNTQYWMENSGPVPDSVTCGRHSAATSVSPQQWAKRRINYSEDDAQIPGNVFKLYNSLLPAN